MSEPGDENFDAVVAKRETEEERQTINQIIRDAPSKLYVLYVYGGDYAAVEFERNYDKGGQINIVRRMIKDNLRYEVFEGTENEELGGIQVELRKFGMVDPGFLEFVKLGEDYDNSKHENFYAFQIDELTK